MKDKAAHNPRWQMPTAIPLSEKSSLPSDNSGEMLTCDKGARSALMHQVRCHCRATSDAISLCIKLDGRHVMKNRCGTCAHPHMRMRVIADAPTSL